VVDVSSFGGPTKEYQIKLDPEKLVAYGLSISQVEQQVAANNSNGGGSFIEEGTQQINVQSLVFTEAYRTWNTVVKSANGIAIKIKDIATVVQVRGFGWGRLAGPFIYPMVTLSTIPIPSKALCCCKRRRRRSRPAGHP